MAKKRSGRYRMTPKRRVALRNAQLASARKRKGHRIKNGLRTAGVIGGAVAATFVSYHTNRWIVHPSQAKRDISKASGATARLVRSSARRIKRGRDQKPPVVTHKQVQWHKHGYL